ncbi:MAG: uracil-DNA glycosylase family protein, partial [Chthoniobacterales bacterium]
MNDFRAALDVVITGLEQIQRESERRPRASTDLLERIRRIQIPVQAATPRGTSKAAKLAALAAPVSICVKCPHLARFRTQTVFGVGNPDADLMFIGEAPGADEDARGEPFVGRAGQLLTKIIQAMGFARADVYIANVLKCRPDMPPGV